ncbi:MAG: cobalamin-dependent protein, partial [Candidatus Firestonebacteria bacterium]
MKKKKILMIYPGQLIHFRYGNNFPVKQQLLSLFSYLKAHGVSEIEILDLGVEIREDIKVEEDVVEFERRCEQLIGCYKFDIACISCFTTFNYTASVLVGKLCRKINPNANIVVGGWHGQLCPEDFLESKGIFDFLVVGQGEKILLDIVKGKIEKNDEKTRLVYGENLATEDYNTFDYEFSDYILHCQSLKDTENITTIEFNLSQQCPYECSYCANNLLDDRKWAAFNVEKSLKQIDRAISVFENLTVITINEAIFGFEKK